MSENVVILAAGEGTRLRPLTNSLPKGMVPFFGKPLLEWQIKVIREVGITDICIVGGYQASKLEALKVPTIRNTEFQSSNMVWSLYKAKEMLKPNTIITYGDILYHPEIISMLTQARADISVSIDVNWRSYWEARSDDPINDAESLVYNDTGAIVEIGKKVESLSSPQGQFMGLIKIGKLGHEFINDIFTSVSKGDRTNSEFRTCYMTDLLQLAIDEGIDVRPVLTNRSWVEVDTIEDYYLPHTEHRIQNILKTIK